MKLTSMKLTAADREKRSEPKTMATEGPSYPYGLSLSLDEDALDKLDLATLPDVDTTLQLAARVTVTAVSSHESTEGKRRSLSLQITDLALEAPAKDAKDVLYGD